MKAVLAGLLPNAVLSACNMAADPVCHNMLEQHQISHLYTRRVPGLADKTATRSLQYNIFQRCCPSAPAETGGLIEFASA